MEKTKCDTDNKPWLRLAPEKLDRPRSFSCPDPPEAIHTTLSERKVVAFGKLYPMTMFWLPDGQSLSLLYCEGLLSHAVIYDGTTGYDATHIARQMKNIPHVIQDRGTVEVNGTAVVAWQAYRELSKLQSSELPRPGDLARKSMRDLDAIVAKKARLEYIPYGMNGDRGNETGAAVFMRLEELGFSTPRHFKVMRGVGRDQVRQIQKVMSAFHSPYPATGLVFAHDFTAMGTAKPTQRHILALLWSYDIYADDGYGLKWLLKE